MCHKNGLLAQLVLWLNLGIIIFSSGFYEIFDLLSSVIFLFFVTRIIASSVTHHIEIFIVSRIVQRPLIWLLSTYISCRTFFVREIWRRYSQTSTLQENFVFFTMRIELWQCVTSQEFYHFNVFFILCYSTWVSFL